MGVGWEVGNPTMWLNQAPGQALTFLEDTGSGRWGQAGQWAPWPGERHLTGPPLRLAPYPPSRA